MGAGLVLVLLLLLSIAAALAVPSPVPPPDPQVPPGSAASPAQAEEQGDIALYRRVAARVAAGDNYYTAATQENRSHDYPTRPFVTIRLPTLAWLTAWLGEGGFWIVLVALLAANAFALPRALATGRTVLGMAAAVLAGGLAVLVPDAKYMHEVWAGLLLTLSFALWRPGRWWPALVPAALALVLRETALPFVLLWAAFAALSRRWSELAALSALIAVFAVGLAFHAGAVEAALLPGDRASQGWAGMLGPAPFLQGVQMLTPLVVLPAWIAGPVAVLGLFGFVAAGGRQGLFASLWLLGLVAMLAIFARADNWYWAALGLPLLFAGLALAPRGIGDLIAGLRGARLAGRDGHHG